MYKVLFILLVTPFFTFANVDSTKKETAPAKEVKKQWYETIQLRGYMQTRYNRLLETNGKLKCEQCDRSMGEGGGFFIRRMRLIFSGNVGPKVYFYVQPDFASNASATSLHFGQIRDMYVDVAFDDKKEFRARIGQSKVPYGFENMQSSQNRLPLDRNDALNSPLSNERDLGVFLYYAPSKIRTLFASLVADGLKGSGDYGVIGFGAYNGQNANKPEANNTPHIVGRIAYPFETKSGQIIEAGVQAFTGKWVVAPDIRSTGIKGNTNFEYKDQRIAGTFVLYPKPFGIFAEYNVGTGPEFNKQTKAIENTKLKGGYTTLTYLIKTKKQIFMPFTRYQYYDGGKKHELDARSYLVKELELGLEWQPNKNFELVTMYTISDRTFEDLKTPNNRQKGSLLRLQAQLNF